MTENQYRWLDAICLWFGVCAIAVWFRRRGVHKEKVMNRNLKFRVGDAVKHQGSKWFVRKIDFTSLPYCIERDAATQGQFSMTMKIWVREEELTLWQPGPKFGRDKIICLSEPGKCEL